MFMGMFLPKKIKVSNYYYQNKESLALFILLIRVLIVSAIS